MKLKNTNNNDVNDKKADDMFQILNIYLQPLELLPELISSIVPIPFLLLLVGWKTILISRYKK